MVIADLEVPGTRQRWWFLPSFVLAWFGVNLVGGALTGAAIPKVLAYTDDAGKTNDFSLLVAVGGIVVMIITPLFGRLSDRTVSRWGIRKPWMLGGTVVGMIGVVGLAFTHRLPLMIIFAAVCQIGFGAVNMAAPSTAVFMIAILVVGAGQGAYISVDVALMTEVLPSFANAGKDLGVVALAYQVPQLLVPVVASVLLPLAGGNNYSALYVFAICMAVVGGLAILTIKKVR